MNLSGILVITRTGHVAETVERLDRLPGVEVHYRDDASGKIVVVQEAETVPDEVEGLKRIKALPNLLLAEMVHHRFDEASESEFQVPKELDTLEGMDRDAIPAFLRDAGDGGGSPP